MAEVLKSEAILISSKTCRHPEIVQLIKTRILGYMTAVSYMMIQYNISRSLLAEAVKVCADLFILVLCVNLIVLCRSRQEREPRQFLLWMMGKVIFITFVVFLNLFLFM